MIHRKEILITKLKNKIQLCKTSKYKRLLLSPIKTVLKKYYEIKAKKSEVYFNKKVRLFNGEEMHIILPEYVSSFIYRFGYFEEELTYAIIELLKEGDTFIDIGSHFGYYTIVASSIVGKNGNVHSFEPTKSTYNILKSNVQNRKNTLINNNAVWSSNTEILFKDFGIMHSAFNSAYLPRLTENMKNILPEIKEYPVKAISLDDYCEYNKITPDFIKIDAESAEFEILKGMNKILTSQQPVISLEVGDFEIEGVASNKEIIDYLISFGFVAYEVINLKFTKHFLKEKYSYSNLFFLPKHKQI